MSSGGYPIPPQKKKEKKILKCDAYKILHFLNYVGFWLVACFLLELIPHVKVWEFLRWHLIQ